MTVKDEIAADMGAILSPEEFGETVTYLPAEGGSFPIPAIVHRAEPNPRPESPRGAFRGAQVVVRHSTDPTKGIASPKREDKLQLVLRQGDAAVATSITRISAGEGFWILGVTG